MSPRFLRRTIDGANPIIQTILTPEDVKFIPVSVLRTDLLCVDSGFRRRACRRQWAGKVTGDAKTEGEGKADQVKGKVQNTEGGLKDAVRGK
jgi:hypothetical protein